MNSDFIQTTPEDLDTSNKRVAWAVPLLMLAFFAAIFPFTWNYEKHHPDERHYTDAAAIMVASGDYLTPFTPEGDLRLKKPILTYWLVAVGYKVFGVSSLTSRLPFLILGTLIIALTYRAYKEIDNNRQNAFLAACAVAIQPSLIISSMRSIPDVLLTFCLLVSGLGFVRLFNRDKPDLLSLAAAYGGLGLAVEAKGLPALVFGALAFFFLVVFRAENVRAYLTRHLLGWGMFLVVALSWFIAMYELHHDELIRQFLGDQVGERVATSKLSVLKNFGMVIGFAVISCLPWAGALFEAILAKVQRFKVVNALLLPIQQSKNIANRILQVADRDPGLCLFTAWIVTFLILAANVADPSLRYLCAIAPFIACVIAAQVGRLPFERLGIWLKRLNLLSALALALGGLVLYAASQLFGGKPALAIGVLVFVLIWSTCSFYNVWFIKNANTQLIVAVAMMLAFVPMTYIACRSFAYSHFENELLAKYVRITDGRLPLAVMTIPSHASRIRVASGGHVTVKLCDENDKRWLLQTGESQFDVLLVNQQCEQCINSKLYQTQKIRDGYSGLELWAFLVEAMHGHGKEYLRKHEQNLTLAVRRLFKESDEQSIALGPEIVAPPESRTREAENSSAGKAISNRTAAKPMDSQSPIFR